MLTYTAWRELFQPPPEAGQWTVDDGARDQAKVHRIEDHHGVVHAVLPVKDRVIREAGVVSEDEECESGLGERVGAVDDDVMRTQGYVLERDVKRLSGI